MTKKTGMYRMIPLVFTFALGTIASETSDYIHYRLGLKYKNENKMEQAIGEFKRVLAAYPDNYNAYMHLAEIRMAQGETRLAIFNLKKALSYNPGWGRAHKLLARAYEDDGQYEAAIMTLQQYQQSCDPVERDSLQAGINYLILRSQGHDVPRPGVDSSAKEVGPGTAGVKKKVSPKTLPRAVGSKSPEVEQLFKRGMEEYDARQYEKSLETMRAVLGMQRDHPGAYYYAGLIRRRNGQNNMAKINFEKALAYPELGYNALFYLGRIHGEEENYGEAISFLESYIEKTSSEEGQREAREMITRYRAAIVQAREREAAKKKMTLPLDLEVERGVKEPAYEPIEMRIDSLLSMVIVDTLSDAGQKMLAGVRLFKENRFDDAVEAFKKMLVDYPTGSTAAQCIYNIGVCYYKMRLFKDAENQFRQVIGRFPSHMLSSRSAFLEAMTYLERKESARAESLLRAFIQQNRKHEWVGKAYERLGDAYLDLEKPKKAIDAYEQAAAQAGGIIDKIYSWYKLGSVYFDVDNQSRGLAALRKVIQEGEKNGVYVRVPDSYFKIADYHYAQKDYKTSLALYKDVTRKYPAYQETPWGIFQTGNIYKKTQQYKDAIEHYKKLMESYPEDYWAKQARWKVEDTVWENEYRGMLR